MGFVYSSAMTCEENLLSVLGNLTCLVLHLAGQIQTDGRERNRWERAFSRSINIHRCVIVGYFYDTVLCMAIVIAAATSRS